MKASIVDLRYRTREILEALARNESVTVLYHGKVKGVLHPAGRPEPSRVADHPFFAMHAGEQPTVAEEMEQLRHPRHDV